MEREAKKQKTLRGWKLQQELEHPCQKDALEQEDCNPLVLRLVQLWSQGKISAVQAAQIAHLSMLGGCDHPDVVAMARCGHFGQNQGGCHRDMVNLHCKGIMLPEPHLVKVLLKDPKTQTAQPQDIALMLPHMIFSFLSDNYTECFEEIFAVKECASFWKSVENMKDLLSKGASLCSHILLTAVPKSCTLKETWDPLDSWICWREALDQRASCWACRQALDKRQP